jgi:bifunctional non-homologous end joining protein LigD
MSISRAFQRAAPKSRPGPDWLHEIKHDGYRLIVQREGKRLRLLTRRGYDWSDRYPLIVQSALRLRKTSFVIDGEAVVLGTDGISEFETLYGGKRNAEVRLYAFDLLMDDGVDMRDETLRIRKLWLGKLLKRCGDGILYNDHEAARSALAYSNKLARWAWRGSFQSIGTAPIKPADRRTGLRSKTPSRPPWFAPRMGDGDTRTEDHLGANVPDGRSAF